MSVFEYIMVLVSIIIGLGITHILKNIVFLIQHKDVQFYWVHTLWCIDIFFTLPPEAQPASACISSCAKM